MRWTFVAVVACVAACGRLGFHEISATASGNDGGTDIASTGDAAEPSGLLLHFAFESDGLLHDRASGNDGTCASCPTAVAGRVGATAAQFSGAQCIHIAEGPTFRPPAFTFAAWVEINTSASQGEFFGRTYQAPTSGGMATFETWARSGSELAVAVNNTGLPGPSIAIGEWRHIAGAYDGTSLAYYVDGAFRWTFSVGAPRYDVDNFLIGCSVFSGGEFAWLTGAIDDVRFYDHALTAGEIAALFAL